MFNHESTIIWDWNGTLLNDVSICINTMNVILNKRGLKSLTKERYQDIFQFPVIEYYKKLGFDFNKDSFEVLSVEFIEGYNRELKNAELFEYSVDLLKELKARNYIQIIISAMEKSALVNSLHDKEIPEYFDHIIGINDHYADGKLEFAVDFIRKNNIHPEKIILIGDTTHDYEVAKAIGCKCLLVANGHQSFSRLSVMPVPVKKNLKSILGLISN
jgi:phosphoglycolate phosphatase